jgi:1,4-dihydroxy-2-naphthoate octaprenyltransferase
VTAWWLLAPGAAAVLAAWYYTGGRRPYGYRGLGEAAVFLFFGLLAVTGTAYVQMRELSWLGLAAAIPVGLLACALLVVNNLRDIGTDATAGKRTLAVLLGDRRSRVLYGACALLPFGAAIAIAPVRPLALLTLAAVPLVLAPVRLVASGASGRVLIAVLGQTGRAQLAFGALLAIGLAIRP